MKWPSSITFIRHGESKYNELRQKKDVDSDYQQFKNSYESDFQSPLTRHLAAIAREKYFLKMGDYETPLTTTGVQQAERTGRALSDRKPDVVFYSPYFRTRQTLESLQVHWKAIRNVPQVDDDRIREQEHGLSLLYNDWRVFHTFHPEQKELYELLGRYWYQYPQGESAAQVRDRARAFTNTVIREWAGKHVLVITHHLTILSFRANYERFSPEEFIRLDEEEKPKNCGVTVYECDPDQGREGRLVLKAYNQKYY